MTLNPNFKVRPLCCAHTSVCNMFSMACRQVLDLERMVKERDEMIDELKATNAEQRNRLAHSSDEETHQLQQQRSSLEQHYKCIIDEMNSRNEVLLASLCVLIFKRLTLR